MPPRADLSRPLWSQFLAFLAPMMLSNILQALSGTINNIYLGQMIGTDALAAASVFFPIMFFFLSLVLGLGAGASVLIGQAWGAGDRERVRDVAATTLTAALVAGVAIAVGLTPAARLLMTALGTPEAVLPGAVAYASVMLAAMPVAFAFLLITQLLRGVGDTVTPLLALAVSISLSMVLTPALIRGWLGLRPLGVASAACATVTAWSATLVAMGFYLRWRRGPLMPDGRFWRAMRPDWRILGQVLRLGVPSALRCGQPGARLCAVSGDVDRDHRDDPERAGDRRRPDRDAGPDSARRPAVQPGSDRHAGGAGLSVFRPAGRPVHHPGGGDRPDPDPAAYRAVECGGVSRWSRCRRPGG
jgi:Na+-driven multidrug efflux pump